MPIKFLLLGGGSGFWEGGGVEVAILLLWAWGFFRRMVVSADRQRGNAQSENASEKSSTILRKKSD